MTTEETQLLQLLGEQAPTAHESLCEEMDLDVFKIGFLAAAGGQRTSCTSIQAYFNNILPIWTTSGHQYCGTEHNMGYIEGQLHCERMQVYGDIAPNWCEIAKSAKLIQAKVLTKEQVIVIVKQLLADCENAKHSVDKAVITSSIMWALVHNKWFLHSYDGFSKMVHQKLCEFVERRNPTLTEEEDHHLQLQHLAYFKLLFPNASDVPVVNRAWQDVNRSIAQPPTRHQPNPICMPLCGVTTRSGRISRPPVRLTG